MFYLATREGANLEDLNENMKLRYGEAMHTALVAKQKLSLTNLKRVENGMSCKLLNHADIQDCIDMVNTEGMNETAKGRGEADLKFSYFLPLR